WILQDRHHSSDIMEHVHDRQRWVVLALTCVLLTAVYYCYDNPAALKTQLQQHLSPSSADEFELDFNLLYTFYSVPNIVLPFVGGALIDRLGTNEALMIFCAFVPVGQTVVAMGSALTSTKVMLVGRFVFGLGGECLTVTQEAIVTRWFKHDELAFALGLTLGLGRLGSVLNNEVSPTVANSTNVTIALLVGVLVCIVSTIAGAFVVLLERRAALRQIKREPSRSHSVRMSDVRHFSSAFWLLSCSCFVVYGCVLPFNNVASSLLMERDYFRQPPEMCARCGHGAYANIACTAIAPTCPTVPPYAWPLPKLSANCTIQHPDDQLLCSTSPPLIDDTGINCDSEAWKRGPLTQTYCAQKALATASAATPMSVPFVISGVLSPVLGLAVDRFGHRATLAMVAPVALSMAHLLLGFTHVSAYVPLVLNGIGYSIFTSVLWPSVPLLVRDDHIGTAYGVMTSTMNLALAIFPIFVAVVHDHSHRYVPDVEWLFLSLALLGCIIAALLHAMDRATGSVLNRAHMSSSPTAPSASPSTREETPLLS
ncbi:TPA: hypothetical protein N0F65_005326, partial [Lagenidium giganteum]